jgi:hypothetical protein
MAVEAAPRFWEAPLDLCIIELGLPWHIGSSLCALCWRCCNSTGLGGAGAMPPHPRNTRATFSFMFLQNLTLVSLSPLLQMYPRWLNILLCKWVSTNPACHLILKLIHIPRCPVANSAPCHCGFQIQPSHNDLQNCSAKQRQIWTKEDSPIEARTTKCTKYTMAFPDKATKEVMKILYILPPSQIIWVFQKKSMSQIRWLVSQFIK